MENLNEKNSINQSDLQKVVSYEFMLNQQRCENKKYETIFVFGTCKVCQNKASGVHYGVSTCEGCKVFFKKSILNHHEYVCQKDGDCKIIPKKHSKCKYCRWNACVKAGMSKQNVKLGRKPNKSKQIIPKMNESMTLIKSICTGCKENSITIKQLVKSVKLNFLNKMDVHKLLPETYFSEVYLKKSSENQIIVLSLLRDKSFQLYKEEAKKFDENERIALEFIESGRNDYTYSLTESFKQYAWKKALNKLMKSLQDFRKYFEQLSGFERVSNNDKIVIIQNHILMYNGFVGLKLFIENDNFRLLDENIFIRRKILGDFIGETRSNQIIDFFLKIKSFNMTEQEIGLLLPYLMSLSNEKIEEKFFLHELNQYYARALYYEFCLNKRNEQFIKRLTQIVWINQKLNKLFLDIIPEGSQDFLEV